MTDVPDTFFCDHPWEVEMAQGGIGHRQFVAVCHTEEEAQWLATVLSRQLKHAILFVKGPSKMTRYAFRSGERFGF